MFNTPKYQDFVELFFSPPDPKANVMILLIAMLRFDYTIIIYCKTRTAWNTPLPHMHGTHMSLTFYKTV